MRPWTLHPKYLDSKGLVAAWREALLAQAVLAGRTRGYQHHPQLARFRTCHRPIPAIASFLTRISEEASRRGYRFDTAKISRSRFAGQIEETTAQLLYEWGHLLAKLRDRAPELCLAYRGISMPEPHPLFRIVPGEIRAWEKRPNQALQTTRLAHPKFEKSISGSRHRLGV